MNSPNTAIPRGQSRGQSRSKPGGIRAIARIAYRNLFHDRVSLAVTLTGIVFSVVLVAVQLGLYLSSERMIATIFDHARGDIWIVPLGTKSFDDPTVLRGREKEQAMAVPGVESTEDLVVGFAGWHKPNGGMTAVLLVGSSPATGGLAIWNVDEGRIADLAAPSAVAVDRTYFADLGISRLGDTSEINGARVSVRVVSNGIRSFTTLPYVFTNLQRARALLEVEATKSSYTLVRLRPGADVTSVKSALAARFKDAEVLTRDEFRQRSVSYWLFQTGAGGALIAGAILGIVVGTVIVAQTLYSSTKDHLNEFATLRALGASASYIHRVILIQAILSSLIGYVLGLAVSLLISLATRHTTLEIVMTPALAALLLALTVGMCVISAMSAIFKVTRIDPATVFSR